MQADSSLRSALHRTVGVVFGSTLSACICCHMGNQIIGRQLTFIQLLLFLQITTYCQQWQRFRRLSGQTNNITLGKILWKKLDLKIYGAFSV